MLRILRAPKLGSLNPLCAPRYTTSLLTSSQQLPRFSAFHSLARPPLAKKTNLLMLPPKCQRVAFVHNGVDPRTNKDDAEKDKEDQEEKEVAPAEDKWRRFGLVGSFIAIAASKTKYVFFALKLTKFGSLASMMLTSAAYSMIFGWQHAVGMVGLIAVHEAGHALAMVYKGIEVSSMIFIPFMGAAVSSKELPRNAYDDAIIALGGPALGSLGALAVFGAAQATDSQMLYALSDFGFMINLINLLPIGMMDGGRIAGALSKYLLLGGLGFGAFAIIEGLTTNPLSYLIMLAACYTTGMRFFGSQTSLPPGFYAISNGQRLGIASMYIGLIVLLVLATAMNNKHRKAPREILAEQRRIAALDHAGANDDSTQDEQQDTLLGWIDTLEASDQEGEGADWDFSVAPPEGFR